MLKLKKVSLMKERELSKDFVFVLTVFISVYKFSNPCDIN